MNKALAVRVAASEARELFLLEGPPIQGPPPPCFRLACQQTVCSSAEYQGPLRPAPVWMDKSKQKRLRSRCPQYDPQA